MSETRCKEVDDRLAELVDGESAAVQEFSSHLATCRECAARLEGAKRTAAWLRKAGDGVSPKSLEADAIFRLAEQRAKARTRRTAAWIGGAAAVAASVAAVVYFSIGTGTEPESQRPAQVAIARDAAGAPASPGPDASQAPLPSGVRGQLVLVMAPEGASVEVKTADGTRSVAKGAGPVDLPAGATVTTDARALATVRLADGTTLSLDRATSLAFDADDEDLLRVASGQMLADVIPREAGRPKLRVALPTGEVSVLGTKFAVRAEADESRVDVARGVVEVRGGSGEPVRAAAGQEAVIPREGAPVVAQVRDLSAVLAWADDLDEGEKAPRGLGSLSANPPGRPERRRDLALAGHKVTVRIQGPVARTEVEEVFQNDTGERLEGVYKFPLPPGASIARLALEVNGKLEEGAFVESERATRIWRGVIRHATPQPVRRSHEEYIWVPGPWRDPALLQWQKGNEFELRIFPIEPHSSRRVIIAYTEVLRPVGTHRRYVYPLPFDEGGSTKAGEFSFEARIGGADPGTKVRSLGYDVAVAVKDGAPEATFTKSDFAPTGDLVLDYALPAKEAGLSAVTYKAGEEERADERSSGRADGDPGPATDSAPAADHQPPATSDQPGFVLFTIRPDLPIKGDPKPRDVLFVVDSSYSAFGDRYQWQVKLVRSMVEQMDHRDRFQVLACDLDCTALWGSFQEPTARNAEEASTRLGRIEPGQATDVGAAFAAAARELRERGSGAADRDARLVYVGDGVASAGEIDAGRLAAEALGELDGAGVRVSTIGTGAEADELVLSTLARRGGGSYFAFAPGRSVRSLALAALSAQYGAALEDARLSLPAGLSDAQPRDLPAVRAGDELLVVARMDDHVQGEVVLKGTVGGEDYEQRYPIDIEVTSAKGNSFVPRVWAEAKIADLTLADAEANQAKIVELSQEHRALSRFTSLLVLESEAMYEAYDIERPEAAEDWTGEEAIEEQSFGGAVEHALADQTGGGGGDGTELETRGGAGRAARSAGNASGPAPARPAAGIAATPAHAEEPQSSVDADRERLAELGYVGRPRPGGQWMRRTWQRRATVEGPVTARNWEERRIEELKAALEEKPESRDRTKALYLALSRAGKIEEALDLAETWWAKDRLDPEALERMALSEQSLGHGGRALRLLGSMADLRPRDVELQKRLAGAYEAAGEYPEACAHRRAAAALVPDDADAAKAAYRCLSWLGKNAQADALIERFGNEMTRSRLRSQLETTEPVAPDVRGDLRIEASWDESADLDIVLVHPDGRRSSWTGGVTGTMAKYADDDRRENLGFRRLQVGLYRIEIVRHGRAEEADEPEEASDEKEGERADERSSGRAVAADEGDIRYADDGDEGERAVARSSGRAVAAEDVRGEVTIRAMGTTRRLSFSLDDDDVRVPVASVEVERFEVMVPVDGAPEPVRWIE
ncbi:MAG: FecR domain-containing protein [Deltaproteobacteria bacterium]|nr:FecR domain-containing protein [Deltaproteobacteria bacterium]